MKKIIKSPTTLLVVLCSLIFAGVSSAQMNMHADLTETGHLQGSDAPDTTYGMFTEISPSDSLFFTPPDEDFWVIATAPGDYDNDGDLDIATLGYYVVYNTSVEEKLVLMRNDGTAGPDEWEFAYIDVPLGSLMTGESDMAWGDYDNDGDLDLALGSDGMTVIYRNDSGALAMTTIALPGYWEDNSQAEFDLRSITWADFDNDGDADLLIPSVWEGTPGPFRTALMRNDGPDGSGGWIFTEISTAFSPTSHAQSCWADCDTDGDLDLLLINVAPVYDDSFIRLYRNLGNGNFAGEDILGTLTVERGEAQWGDYDGDGDLDILVAGNLKENGSYTPLALRIYQNENEVYTPVEVIPNPQAGGWFDFTAATWADYDSDGDMDILVAGNYNSGTNIEGRARILANENGTFTDSGNELPAPRAMGDRGGAFSWLDMDGDGDLDYFIAGQYFVPGGNGLVEAQMHLYRNDAAGFNLAPSAPGGFNFTQISATTAQISWTPSLDDHTPADALTYELNLFYDNMPVSLPARTPEPGNLSAVTEWSLSGLEPGTYTWYLSAVDAAYLGSPKASGEFTMVITASEEITRGKKGTQLDQNFPNPFSGQTTIGYSIAADGPVLLVMYDQHGKPVQILVNQVQSAGSHRITLDGTSLPAGVYSYGIHSNGAMLSRKLIISGSAGL